MGVEILICPEGVRPYLEASRAVGEAAAVAVAVIAARATIESDPLRRALRTLRIGLRIHH